MDAVMSGSPVQSNGLKGQEIVQQIFEVISENGERLEDHSVPRVSRKDFVLAFQKPNEKMKHLFKRDKSLGLLAENVNYIKKLQNDMVLANEDQVTIQEFTQWWAVFKGNLSKVKKAAINPPPARRVMAYGIGERRTERLIQEKLLIPRKKRGIDPVITTPKEDEKDILRTAEAVNERLRISNLNRCPTGRVPGLGTSKSEAILTKTNEIEIQEELRKRKERSEGVFQEWLNRKELEKQQKVQGSRVESEGGKDSKDDSARRAASEREFQEWKRKKDKEMREQRARDKEMRLQKALEQEAFRVKQLPDAGVPVPGKDENVETLQLENLSVSSGSKINSNAQPVLSLDQKFGKKERKRLAPYFVNFRKKQNLWVSDDQARPKSRGGSSRSALPCSQRLSKWTKKRENISQIKRIYKEEIDAHPDLGFEEVLLNIVARADCWKNLPPDLHKHLQAKEQCSSCSKVVKSLLVEAPVIPVKNTLSKASTPTMISAATKRVLNALSECLPHLKQLAAANLNGNEKRTKRSLPRCVSKFLQQSLNTSTSLLNDDLRISCTDYIESGAKSYTLCGFINWLAEHCSKDEQVDLVVDVDGMRSPLRSLYNLFDVPQCPKSIATFLATIDYSSPPKPIEGTIWLDLFSRCPFQEGQFESNGVVSQSEFVEFWMEKYRAYQSESLRVTSPTHKRRASSATRRGKRKGRVFVGSPPSSAPRIRIAKPSKEQQEAKREHEEFIERTYLSSPTPAFPVQVRSPGASRKRPQKGYLQQQARNSDVKTAVAKLATATKQQIINVLNIRQPEQIESTTIGAVCILLGEKPTWKQARSLFKTWPEFIQLVTKASVYTPELNEGDQIKLNEAIKLLQEVDAAQDDRKKLIRLLGNWVCALDLLMRCKNG